VHAAFDWVHRVRRIIKKLLPRVIREAVGEWRALPPGARRAWRGAALRRLLRDKDITHLPAGLPANPVILFVCHGNIFRSPLAAALLRRAASLRPQAPLRIASAGLLDRAGRTSPPEAQEIATELGVSLAEHRSTPLDARMVAEADVIVIMDRRNEALIRTHFPEADGKLVLLGAFDPLPSRDGAVITDPYSRGTDAVREVFQRIDRAVFRLHDAISLGVGEPPARPRWKRTVRQVLQSSALEYAWRPFTRDGIAIFMLHRFEDRERGIHGHSTEVLEAHLEYLRSNAFHIAALDDVVSAAREGRPIPPRTVVFTVDDGYADFARIGAPLLARFDVPATLFLTTGFVDGDCWLWYDVAKYCLSGQVRGDLQLPVGDICIHLRWDTPAQRNREQLRMVHILKQLASEEAETAVQTLLRVTGTTLPEKPPEEFASVSWTEVQRWSANGMRFGAHTCTHPILARASAERSAWEISESWRRIHELTSGTSRIFAYPNGTRRDFGPREVATLGTLGALGAVRSDGGHTKIAQIAAAPFDINRIPYSDDVESVRQALVGAGQVKAMIRGGTK